MVAAVDLLCGTILYLKFSMVRLAVLQLMNQSRMSEIRETLKSYALHEFC